MSVCLLSGWLAIHCYVSKIGYVLEKNVTSTARPGFYRYYSWEKAEFIFKLILYKEKYILHKCSVST